MSTNFKQLVHKNSGIVGIQAYIKRGKQLFTRAELNVSPLFHTSSKTTGTIVF